MERKLASIQRVSEIFPIEGADNIEGCQVLGWKCVVKKGEFKAGDLGVYFEIDSVLPEYPEFEFMAPRKYRVKTIKLRGQISQGLMLPLSGISYADLSNHNEGDDVTELLEVQKFVPQLPAHLKGLAKGNFPGFLRRTDETRIQSMPGFLDRHRGKEFYVSEKLDGTSFTAYLKDDKFGVCSRRLELVEDDTNSYWEAAKKEGIREKMERYSTQMNDIISRNFAIQCELAGPGIQKNKYKLEERKLFIFNVFDIDKYLYLNYMDMVHFANCVGIAHVPIIETITLDHTVDQLVDMSVGFSKLYKTAREGLVFRAVVEEDDPEAGRTSFKVINPKFLLKHDE